MAGIAASAWRHRVQGLSAEIGFWTLLSLPPLLLCLLGLIGYLEGPFGTGLTQEAEKQLLSLASRVLTQETVSSLVQPVLREVLTGGRADVASVGFVLALWAGSMAMSSYVNAIAIAYGQRDERSAVHSRLLALGLYLAAVVTGVVLMPVLVLGPRTLQQLIPRSGDELAQAVIGVGYWPATVVLPTVALATLYHFAVPLRSRWRQHLLGAVLATAIVVAGGAAMRAYLGFAFDTINVYGPVTTPIAALLLFYLTALAVLVGAETNAHRHTSSRRQPPSR